MKRFIAYLLAVLIGLNFISCKQKEVVEVKSVSLNKTNLELKVGQSEQLTVSVLPEEAEIKSTVWVSSKEETATVENGLVRAVASGEAVITVKVNDKEATCKVTVSENAEPEEFTLNKTTLVLEKGETETLKAMNLPEGVEEKDVVWTSSNDKAVSVEGGVVTAVAEGEAVITAKAGDKAATCKVTVTDNSTPKELVLDMTSLEIMEYERKQIKVSKYPNGEAVDVTWTSSDAGVAKVVGGWVTGVAIGEAVITAEADGVKATCKVIVTELEVESIRMSPESMNLQALSTGRCQAYIEPTLAEQKYSIKWSVEDESIASVDENGNVTALKAGVTNVVAEAGGVQGKCALTVEAMEVESVTMNKSELEVEAGSHGILSVAINPGNAAIGQEVTWSSDNEAVATVSADSEEATGGVRYATVKGIAEGTATITVTCGGKSATCAVTVKAVIPATKIAINRGRLNILAGSTVESRLTFTPTNTTDKAVEKLVVTSSDESVATAELERREDYPGYPYVIVKITGVAKGNATIKVSNLNGDVYGTSNVTVMPAINKTEWTELELFEYEGYAKGLVLTVKTDGDAPYVKIMSFEQTTLPWATSTTVKTGYSTSSSDGREGMEAIKPVAEANPGVFKAYEWCAALEGGSWYLPGMKELTTYLSSNTRRKINTALTSFGGTELAPDNTGAYWSNAEDTGKPYEQALYANIMSYSVYSSIGLKTKEMGVFAIMRIDL